ncbi:MAG TPA: hypothetical protein VHN82_08850, partial [Methanoregula sp.]|nr:hypothetical protein [Methanoregula sp.]
ILLAFCMGVLELHDLVDGVETGLLALQSISGVNPSFSGLTPHNLYRSSIPPFTTSEDPLCYLDSQLSF